MDKKEMKKGLEGLQRDSKTSWMGIAAMAIIVLCIIILFAVVIWVKWRLGRAFNM